MLRRAREWLGVQLTDDMRTIKVARDRLLLQCHPDKVKGSDAAEQFKRTQDAFQVMKLYKGR